MRQAADLSRPVFVTQHAFVTAVLLPRSMYDRLLRAADADNLPAQNQTALELETLSNPLAVSGPLPRGTLFETRWGLVDAETATFFIEEGEEVRPHIRRSQG